MSYALTDEVYATTVKEMEGNKQDKYLFYGSAMITFWAIWVLADFLGALVGASFPNIEKYGLDFAMVAAFIAIVVPQIKAGPVPSPPWWYRLQRAVGHPALLPGYCRRLGTWRARRAVRRRLNVNRQRLPNPTCRSWRRWNMNNSYFIALTLGMVAVTFLIRFSFIGTAGKIQMSERVTKTLRFVPVTVPFTIITIQILSVNSSMEFDLKNPKVIAAIICTLASFRLGPCGGGERRRLAGVVELLYVTV